MAPGQISTMADMWSADTTKAAFLGVTGHWIEVKKETRKETWEMRSEVIGFQTVSGDHGDKNLGCYSWVFPTGFGLHLWLSLKYLFYYHD